MSRIMREGVIVETVKAAMAKGRQHISLSIRDEDASISIWPDDSLTVKEIAKWLDNVLFHAEFADTEKQRIKVDDGWEAVIRKAIEDGEFDGD